MSIDLKWNVSSLEGRCVYIYNIYNIHHTIPCYMNNISHTLWSLCNWYTCTHTHVYYWCTQINLKDVKRNIHSKDKMSWDEMKWNKTLFAHFAFNRYFLCRLLLLWPKLQQLFCRTLFSQQPQWKNVFVILSWTSR